MVSGRRVAQFCRIVREVIILAHIIVGQQMDDLTRTNLAKPLLEHDGLLVQFWRKGDLVRRIVDTNVAALAASPSDLS